MNYIYCAWEPEEKLYRVYDGDGLLVPAEFEYDSTMYPAWRAQVAAEAMAASLARKFDCDWGTNYP